MIDFRYHLVSLISVFLALAVGIVEHTADWHMMQRVFVEDLDPARLPAAPESAATHPGSEA